MRQISNKIMDIALTREDTAYHAGKGSKSAWQKYAGEECIMDHAIGTATQIIQAYLSEIWKPFDAENVSQIELDKQYFLLCVDIKGVTKIEKGWFDKDGYWNGNGLGLMKKVIAYLDPADILPKEYK